MAEPRTIIRRLDAWIGLRLFHPPIVALCQRAGITQWAFYRYGWWVYTLWAVWRDDHASLAESLFLVAFALVRTLSAGLSLNRPVRASLVVRAMLWAILAVLLLPPFDRASLEAVAWQWVVLAAEYAATIRTVPPRPQPKRRPREREAWT